MEEKRKANIFENCTCQQVNMARNTALQIKNAHLDCSRCWQHLQEATKKLSHSQWVGRSKKRSVFLLRNFHIFFSIIDAKAYKKIKTRIYQVWKIQLLCLCCLRLQVHAWIHPRLKLIVFFMVSFLILLRSLRVYILKQ